VKRIWDATETYFVFEQEEHDIPIMIEWVRQFKKEDADEIDRAIKEYNIKRTWFAAIQLYYGKLNVELLAPPSAEVEPILLKIGAAFDLAYKRFLDLQKSEAQAQQIREEKTRLEQTLQHLQVTQKQLIQKEKMASLGELTAGIAHEIQNPLNFVNNFSAVNQELLQEIKQELDKGNFSEVRVIVSDIEANEEKIGHHGKRADSIVKGMLQHARASTGKKEPTNINQLADEYLRLGYQAMRTKDKEFNAHIETTFDQTVGQVSVVPQDIGRVLLNLFNNAFYAVQQKKQQLNGTYEAVVSVSTRKYGNNIIIAVKDNGNGIPEKVVDKVFQPFFTTKPTGEGTGLGLSLSYDVVTKGHGGSLSVTSTEGEGTEFVVQLPAS
jgi:signal transduction histidine kinase